MLAHALKSSNSMTSVNVIKKQALFITKLEIQDIFKRAILYTNVEPSCKEICSKAVTISMIKLIPWS